MNRILMYITYVTIVLFISCTPKSSVRQGYYYKKIQYLEKTVYSFIQIKNTNFIVDHSLYLDSSRKSLFRKPYQPEIYTFEVINGCLVVHDQTGSYEVIKKSLFGKNEVITTPRYRISSCSGQICLKNLDISDDVYIYSDIQR